MVFIRDRTNLFVSYRQSYTHAPPDSNSELLTPSLLQNDSESIDVDGAPPQWLEITQQLETALFKINQEILQLKPLHKHNSLPGLDDRTNLDKEIEAITIAITKGLHRCQALVKSFAEIVKLQRTPQLQQMAHNMQVSMAAKLQDTSTNFRQMQSAYLKALQQDELGELPGFISNTTSNTIEDDVYLSQAAIQRQSTQSLNFEDQEVQQREEGISRVADTILEVADIFRDLQTMVIDQGALVDRIDYNVEHTLTDVKGASEQLVKGERYQKRTAKCKIILLLVLVVIGLILVLIFKPKSSTKTVYYKPDPQPSGNSASGSASGSANAV